MPKKRKAGFIYIQSDLLKQEIAFSKETGRVYCEDGVVYSYEELVVICDTGMELDIETHLIKKVMGGEVVKYERNGTRDNNSGKPNERKNPDNPDNNSNQGGRIQDAPRDDEKDENGYLDIY